MAEYYKPTKQEVEKLGEDARKVAEVMAKAMFDASQDKRTCMVAAMRVASGAAAMGGLDLHRSVQMFMAFYKEAEASFDKETLQ